MLLEPPTKLSQREVMLDVREIEPLLSAPAIGMQHWPGATITLKDGRTMYIREATLEEAPDMMRYMKRVMEAEHDFYDVVGARVRWAVGMAQPSYPWPQYQHELGGARVYYVTKKYWDTVVKDYVRQM